MYRRSKFLELLLEIREDMAREAGHDVDQFVQDLRKEVSKQEHKLPADLAEFTDVRPSSAEITKVASDGRNS